MPLAAAQSVLQVFTVFSARRFRCIQTATLSGGYVMPEPLSPLMIEFLAWVDSSPRTYNEAMEAWRSTCPRHTIWEDALLEGFIQVGSAGTPQPSEVTLTARGRAILNGNLSRQSAHVAP